MPTTTTDDPLDDDDNEILEFSELDPELASLFGDVDTPPDRIQLITGGRVLLTIDGARYAMKGPRIGGYRELREELEVVRELVARRQELAGLLSNDGREVDLEKLNDVKGDLLEMMDRVEEAAFAWWDHAFKVTGTEAADLAGDARPTWFADLPTIQDIMQHWRTSPLGRGRRRRG